MYNTTKEIYLTYHEKKKKNYIRYTPFIWDITINILENNEFKSKQLRPWRKRRGRVKQSIYCGEFESAVTSFQTLKHEQRRWECLGDPLMTSIKHQLVINSLSTCYQLVSICSFAHLYLSALRFVTNMPKYQLVINSNKYQFVPAGSTYKLSTRTSRSCIISRQDAVNNK
jgi:hypothetical protein